MPVNKTLRDGAGVKAGDIVDVVMERDEQKRTVQPPAVLKEALTKNKVAKANWQKMAFTHKKEIALWIGQRKKRKRGRDGWQKPWNVGEGDEQDRVRIGYLRA
jgi:hypothetical protein